MVYGIPEFHYEALYALEVEYGDYVKASLVMENDLPYHLVPN
jgi:hypothetical protein